MLKNPMYERIEGELNRLIAEDERETLGHSVARSRLRSLLEGEALIASVNRVTGVVAFGQMAILQYHGDRSIPYTWWFVPDTLVLAHRPGSIDVSDLCRWHDMGWGAEVIGRSGRNSQEIEQTILCDAWIKSLNCSHFEGK